MKQILQLGILAVFSLVVATPAEAQRIDEICCRSMEQITGTVPIACEYALSRRWYKQRW